MLAPASAVTTVFAVALLTLAVGGHESPAVGLALGAQALARAGWAPALYVLAAWGIGRTLLRFGPVARSLGTHHWTIEAALGIAALTMISHALGVLGLFGGALAQPLAWLAVSLGIAAALTPHVRRALAATSGPTGAPTRPDRPAQAQDRWIPVCLVLAAATPMVLAATSPPGWLWRSEFGGYDALSYHLQLPKEWLALGRIWPLPHNVYSHLPSAIEAAFVHIALLMGLTGEDTNGVSSFVSSDGAGLVACQLLHAMLAILAALAVAPFLHALLRSQPRDADDRPGVQALASLAWPCTLASVIVLLTPWAVVVGSLAYNEMGVLLLGIAACSVALDRASAPAARAALVAALVGGACCFKPTALLFIAPSAGLMLALRTRPRAWPAMIACGLVAGLAMLAPWLARNHVASGNALFPFMHSVLGPGHWDAEQHARYAAAHAPQASVLDRALLLVSPTGSGEGPLTEQHRGLSSPQWMPTAALAGVAAGALCVLAAARRSLAPIRPTFLPLVCLGLQAIAWIALTHNQSRFLLPMLPLLAVLAVMPLAVRLAGTKVPTALPPAWISPATIALSLAMLACTLGLLVAREGNGRSMALVGQGSVIFTGELLQRELAAAQATDDRAARQRALAAAPVHATVNALLGPASRLLLVGDAAPLYARSNVVWSTTWDRPMLAAVVRSHSGDADAWIAELAARGVTHVCVHFGELERLAEDGWLDPALTPEVVERFTAALGQPVWASSVAPVALFELPRLQTGTVPREGLP